MALYIDDRPSFGSQIAGALGTSIGSGLSALAENKLQRMQQASAVNRLGALGVDPQSAAYILSLPQEQQPGVVGNYLQQVRPQQQQQQMGGLEQMLQTPQQQAPMQQAPRVQQQQPNLQQVLSNLQGSPVAPQLLQEQFQRAASQRKEPELLEQVAAQQATQEEKGGQNIMDIIKALRQEQQQPDSAQAAPVQQRPVSPLGAALTAGAGLKPSEQLALRKEERAERESAYKKEQAEKSEFKREKEIANKETKKYYDDMLKADKTASDNDLRLSRMEELIKEGTPPAALYASLKKLEDVSIPGGAAAGGALGGLIGGLTAGIPTLGAGTPAGFAAGAGAGTAIGGALGGAASSIGTLSMYALRGYYPTTEEFEKLSNDFIKGAKDIFGARITDADLKAFYQMIPTLMNTDRGKLAVMRNMRLFNEAQHIRTKEMKKIIKKEGYRPINLPELVEENVEPQLERIATRFENNAQKNQESIKKLLAKR